MKILIVEDNIKMRAMIKKYLDQHIRNIEHIYECDDGSDAIKLYNKLQPDWVLMDIQLKTTNGLKTTQTITHAHPTAKIIIVTQYDDPAYREAASEAGAVDFVLKDNILEIVKTMLNN